MSEATATLESDIPDIEPIDPKDPERFINRELSDLAFILRVLEEAENPSVPLLERLRFLSISATNLDEFYRVRVGGLSAQKQAMVDKPSQDGLTPAEQLELVDESSNALVALQDEVWEALRADLRDAGIVIVKREDLSERDHAQLRDFFDRHVFAALTPLAIDPAHPFPFVPDGDILLILNMRRTADGHVMKALLSLPQSIFRFVRLRGGKGIRFLPLEDLIILFLDRIFSGFEVLGCGLCRVLRSSDLELEDDAEDLLHGVELAIKRRRRASVVRIKFNTAMPEDLRRYVAERLHLISAEDLEILEETDGEVSAMEFVGVDGLLGLADAGQLVDQLFEDGRPELKFEPYQPRSAERIAEFEGDSFAAIRDKDILLHYPYESFDVVVAFLRQAAADPDVVSIKQTIYRSDRDSPIVSALVEAAEAGKSVTAVIELAARDDEAANIGFARRLEKAGAQVVYGYFNLKTHFKAISVVRREADGLRSYVHYGTGNYHQGSARLYTDLSFLSADPALGRDAALLFNFVTGYAKPEKFEKIAISPLNLRDTLIDLIGDEIEHAKAGRPAVIWAKLNRVVDSKIIDAFYDASRAGVTIELIVRGVCCLRPGVPGLSENIRVKSIVGRFLEHSRIMCFGAGHGLPSRKAKVFLSSCDWMPHKFDQRVECLVPVSNATVHEQILDQIMIANLKDSVQSWSLGPDGVYERVKSDDKFSAQNYFMSNPSLSGRGAALKMGRAVPKLELGDRS